MNILRYDHIGVRVRNLDSAIQFYQGLGFSLTRNDANESVAALLHSNGMEINLLDTSSEGVAASNVLMDEDIKYPGYTHVAFQVSDVSEAKLELESLGHVITEGPVTFGDGKTSIFIRDPDRNVIEFTQHQE